MEPTNYQTKKQNAVEGKAEFILKTWKKIPKCDSSLKLERSGGRLIFFNIIEKPWLRWKCSLMKKEVKKLQTK